MKSGDVIVDFSLFLLILSYFPFIRVESATATADGSCVCIIGSGIAGSSVAHFIRQYLSESLIPSPGDILVFERHGRVGGRMSAITIRGDTFEAGAAIIHPKNAYALNFTKSLGLRIRKSSTNDDSFGIWDGTRFVFRTISSKSKFPLYKKFVSLFNSLLVFYRYGPSLFKMQSFVESAVNKFLKYYADFDTRPVFGTVDEMLKWSGLYELTRRTLKDELDDAGLSPLLISELVAVITRINYGQSVSISGLAGAVSLAGSAGGLWAVEGGNWQIAHGLLNKSDVTLFLREEIEAITRLENYYELYSTTGNRYTCKVTVVASALDELKIRFSPPISIPKRELQHTHVTFVRGMLDPAYFGLHAVSEIPGLVGTVEIPGLPFSSISVLKKYAEDDVAYKLFSRWPLEETLLDQMFRGRNETKYIDWGAYPHYKTPEEFAPFVLDDRHLYYINAFESAASTIETSAVAAENVARLILSRVSSGEFIHKTVRSTDLHFEL